MDGIAIVLRSTSRRIVARVHLPEAAREGFSPAAGDVLAIPIGHATATAPPLGRREPARRCCLAVHAPPRSARKVGRGRSCAGSNAKRDRLPARQC